MKCDRCNKPAVVHQVIIKGDQHREVHLCAAHAKEAGVPNPGHPHGGHPPGKTKPGPHPASINRMPTCPKCATTLNRIRKDSLFGCPTCYDTFGKGADIMIERSQGGATHHVGRGPQGSERDVALRFESRRLVEELEQAVRAEQYERAAELKAKITQLADQPHADGGNS